MARKCVECGLFEDFMAKPSFCTSANGQHDYREIVPMPEPTTPSVRDPVLEAKQHSFENASRLLLEKETRPAFRRIFMGFAKALAQRSTCARLHVGCVIASHDFRQVFSIGYNGNVTNGKNDCDRHGAEAVGNCGCIHAEQNAVINCVAPRDSSKIVLVTHLPCVMCAKFLINLGGVQRVFYAEDYRNRDALQLFDFHNIQHEHYT